MQSLRVINQMENTIFNKVQSQNQCLEHWRIVDGVLHLFQGLVFRKRMYPIFCLKQSKATTKVSTPFYPKTHPLSSFWRSVFSDFLWISFAFFLKSSTALLVCLFSAHSSHRKRKQNYVSSQTFLLISCMWPEFWERLPTLYLLFYIWR